MLFKKDRTLKAANRFTTFLKVSLRNSVKDFPSMSEKFLELFSVTIVNETMKLPKKHARIMVSFPI